MRTNKFFKTGLLLFVASLGLISCGDDDKEPEIVIDPPCKRKCGILH